MSKIKYPLSIFFRSSFPSSDDLEFSFFDWFLLLDFRGEDALKFAELFEVGVIGFRCLTYDSKFLSCVHHSLVKIGLSLIFKL